MALFSMIKPLLAIYHLALIMHVLVTNTCISHWLDLKLSKKSTASKQFIVSNFLACRHKCTLYCSVVFFLFFPKKVTVLEPEETTEIKDFFNRGVLYDYLLHM